MSTAKSKILIVGGGLGGITLALLLRRAGVYYEISDVEAHRQILLGYQTMIQCLFHVQTTQFLGEIQRIGYHGYAVSRPELYDLLLRFIPTHKIHLQKRVLSTTQDADAVTISTADNMKHSGDILVGADGTYSSVPQKMQKLKNR
ncbi:hypothetical protein BGZ93_008315 [Podila epicladia]|nr:hypothetical protein BGZ93_008315 [Podila epicladia]